MSWGTKPVLYSLCYVNWVLAVVVPNLACCKWGMQVPITKQLFLTSLLVFISFTWGTIGFMVVVIFSLTVDGT